MKLEQQLETLAPLGICLNEGVNIDDLLYSFPRDNFEDRPFHTLLFILGVEVERAPMGRRFCDSVFNFDTECIYATGDYVTIVKRLALLANRSAEVTEVRDFIDHQGGEAWLEYTIGDRARRWTVELQSDWADMMVIAYVMDDLERDGRKFRARDNGQAMVLYYLDDAAAQQLGALLGKPLTDVVVA